MSRSRYVYVVLSPTNDEPIAGFTVKHELNAWLEVFKHNSSHTPRVIRIKDCGSRLHETCDITWAL